MATGVIITAVAVLDIHMEIKAVATIKPSTIREGLVPSQATSPNAMRRCRFHFSIVFPIKKPAMNRKMISLPYSPEMLFKGKTPLKGKSTRGNKEVAAALTGSVIHQIAIQTVMAAVICAA